MCWIRNALALSLLQMLRATSVF